MDATRRTEQYVIDQSEVPETALQSCDGGVPAKTQLSPSISSSHLKLEATPFFSNQTNTASQPPHLTLQQPCSYGDEYVRESCKVRFENNHVQHSIPQNVNGHPTHLPYPTSSNSNKGSSDINYFVRYFARRELVATGLLQFNDKPQNYRAWKRSFQTATSGLDLTPSEEMDLLLKWLGKESGENVEQIRAIHINHPEAGLAMIWDRLEQIFGSAEVIEDALFRRIDAFPKIANRDYSKLTQLSDLLMELAAKAEGDLPGLSFLDTARGVNPIVHKLPFCLQEKWASIGAAYKRNKCVPYAPFTCFVNFVSQEASIRTDPSFNFLSHLDPAPRPEKTVWKPKYREVSVHKTDSSKGHL